MFLTKLCVMLKSFANKMQKNAAVLTTICMLLCFALNYTFPLHRESLKLSSSSSEYANNTHHWDDFLHSASIIDRTKKMAYDLEDVLKRIKNTAQDFGKSHAKDPKRDDTNRLSEEDLRQYEQLVIMKKYPYLDLKELEFKYSPLSSKNTRQSFGFESDVNLRADSNLCDTEEGLNVEIINRGLSGFSIPPKLTKGVAMVESKSKLNNLKNDKAEDSVMLSKKSPQRETLVI
ncbi:uncharacterized protein LOC114360248 [Ostrinia furnacalis]|uniref:uncharacterized protein LOC114360248 n=1 Tax=Ostrinia furnacalis TaxID=93504 RepID=UPI00103E0C61|nr:uncharacterized protein LOC114360248 [Ostrinia furnacalis]